MAGNGIKVVMETPVYKGFSGLYTHTATAAACSLCLPPAKKADPRMKQI